MLRLLYAFLVGLCGAGIVHILIVLLVPGMSDRDAWSRLAVAGELNRVIRLDTRGVSPLWLGPVDPLFAAAACRFDLEDGAVHVQATEAMPYWSASVYDRDGRNIYSFNDRTSAGGALDFVVLTPAQMVETRKDLPEGFEQSVFVEAPVDEAVVVVRIFVPDDSWAPLASRFIGSMSCE